MKVIIQIPCYNEATTLPLTLASVPKAIDGIDQIEILVIDDGSQDNTAEVARALGVHHVVQHSHRRGLARAFETGIDYALQAGADIVVNTDGDNQYPQSEIPRLVAPILETTTDIVIGNRQTHLISDFSLTKKILQALGSWVVRQVSGTTVPDATSGFRAYSRKAALQLNLFTRYTYTLETIIQAGRKGLKVAHIPILTNPKTRPSRLIRSQWDYVIRSMMTIVRIYTLYEPIRAFGLLSAPFFGVGLILIGRFLLLYWAGELFGSARLIQSVVIGATSLVIGFLIMLFGVLADMVSANRRLLEEILYRQKLTTLPNSNPRLSQNN